MAALANLFSLAISSALKVTEGRRDFADVNDAAEGALLGSRVEKEDRVRV